MKKIKMFAILAICLIVVSGCGCSPNMSATKTVDRYLDRYRSEDQVILNELDTFIDGENLTSEQKAIYRDVLKKQYRNLKYSITDEKYDGDTANITVKITVYDLYKVQKNAELYMSNNIGEFYDEDGVYDKTLYINYKLDKMKNATDTVDYTLNIKLEKRDGTWFVVQLSDTDLEKIHGVYNYES